MPSLKDLKESSQAERRKKKERERKKRAVASKPRQASPKANLVRNDQNIRTRTKEEKSGKTRVQTFQGIGRTTGGRTGNLRISAPDPLVAITSAAKKVAERLKKALKEQKKAKSAAKAGRKN
jgi:hypothetical protein